jgi:hypothetical protein
MSPEPTKYYKLDWRLVLTANLQRGFELQEHRLLEEDLRRFVTQRGDLILLQVDFLRLVTVLRYNKTVVEQNNRNHLPLSSVLMTLSTLKGAMIVNLLQTTYQSTTPLFKRLLKKKNKT